MQSRRAFTLIELLIVVAIIAILAAIAVPNFLEAQTRARVSRVASALRTIATGLGAYRVDNNLFPEGTDNPNLYDARIGEFLGPLAKGYYGIRTRTGTTQTAGTHFATLTTPIAYLVEFPTDPFIPDARGFLTYCYRSEKIRGDGYILTSFGPDRDLFEAEDGRLGVGTRNPNPLSTWSDGNSPARLGDINERAVIMVFEGNAAMLDRVEDAGGFRAALADLGYDPTNGTVSDGDLWRVGP